jgi:hypothetical protein
MDARHPLDGFMQDDGDDCDCLFCRGDHRLAAAVSEVLLYMLRPFVAGEEEAQRLMIFMLNYAAAAAANDQEEGAVGEQNLAALPHPREAAAPHPGEEAAVQRHQVELAGPMVIDLTLPPTDVPEVVDLTGHDCEELIDVD